MRIKLIIITVLLTSCGGISKLPSFTAHKIEIRQGNMVTPEMRSKLKLGMSRAQVRTVLGTPLINDALHADRWDYVYRLEVDGKLTEQQRMTVYFESDVLVRIDDGTMPPQPASVSAVVATAAPTVIIPAADETVPALPVEMEPVSAAEPQPEPERVAEVSPPLATERAVTDAVLAWAAVWSARNVEKYLASYAPEFKPANGMSRAAWAAQRSGRIARARAIKVDLSDINVDMQGENLASASFRQNYRADNQTDVMRKTLELEKIGDAWLIVSEHATKK